MTCKHTDKNEIHIELNVREYNTMDYQRNVIAALAKDVDKVVISIDMTDENKED